MNSINTKTHCTVACVEREREREMCFNERETKRGSAVGSVFVRVSRGVALYGHRYSSAPRVFDPQLKGFRGSIPDVSPGILEKVLPAH